MRRVLKVFVILAAAGAVLLATTGIALAAAVAHSGVMSIAVDDHGRDGGRLYIPIPAALIEIGAHTLPLVIPGDELAQLRHELAPYQEGLEALATELATMPDVTLVRVTTDHEHVRIVKEGRMLRITVDSADANIRVSVPAASFGRLLGALT